MKKKQKWNRKKTGRLRLRVEENERNVHLLDMNATSEILHLEKHIGERRTAFSPLHSRENILRNEMFKRQRNAIRHWSGTNNLHLLLLLSLFASDKKLLNEQLASIDAILLEKWCKDRWKRANKMSMDSTNENNNRADWANNRRWNATTVRHRVRRTSRPTERTWSTAFDAFRRWFDCRDANGERLALRRSNRWKTLRDRAKERCVDKISSPAFDEECAEEWPNEVHWRENDWSTIDRPTNGEWSTTHRTNEARRANGEPKEKRPDQRKYLPDRTERADGRDRRVEWRTDTNNKFSSGRNTRPTKSNDPDRRRSTDEFDIADREVSNGDATCWSDKSTNSTFSTFDERAEECEDGPMVALRRSNCSADRATDRPTWHWLKQIAKRQKEKRGKSIRWENIYGETFFNKQNVNDAASREWEKQWKEQTRRQNVVLRLLSGCSPAEKQTRNALFCCPDPLIGRSFDQVELVHWEAFPVPTRSGRRNARIWGEISAISPNHRVTAERTGERKRKIIQLNRTD